MENTVFWIIIVILLFDYGFELYLDWLNTRQLSNTLPEELKGIYNEEEYRKSQDYYKVKQRFSQITGTFSTVLILLTLFFGGFGWLDNHVRSVTENPVLMALLFFGIIGLASDLLTMPFGIYSTFVIEEKFGFNKTTPKTFILDTLKGWLITAVFGGGILSLVVWVYTLTPHYFWLIAWGIIIVFSLFMSMFYTSLILPLFNKQKPLEEGSLRDNLESLSKNTGFHLDNIFVMDGSKRSTKANAFFSGLGPKKRIVLYDTLLNDLSEDEVTAVLAHEIGHYKKKHTLQSIFITIANSGIMLYILSLFLQSSELSSALGAEVPGFHINVLAFGILYSPVSFILGIFMNMLSRKNEYEADKFAGDHYSAQALIEGLKKLSVKSLSNLKPHRLYVFFYYSHPTLLQRMHAFESQL
ncbi:M48 family metallopeptidase [Saccharicrinis sp. FJH54]|uniref:M48 family metallopeptidase n=1 Tax=Saccharicrinis sp. FJH54 TaxID=3344665 RepID=UPI0035D4EC7A